MMNVIALEERTPARSARAFKATGKKVISLKEWREKTRLLRTPHGVHFVTAGINRPVFSIVPSGSNPRYAA